jgi:hypothetical protein
MLRLPQHGVLFTVAAWSLGQKFANKAFQYLAE